MKLNYLISNILLSVSILLSTGLSAVAQSSTKSGVLNATGFTLDNQFIFDLSGEWLFFPNQFVLPAEINNQPVLAKTVAVPGTWNTDTNGNEIMQGFGYGTYLLTISLPKTKPEIITFKTDYIASAYKLFINGKLIKQNGTPAETAAKHTAYSNMVLADYTLAPTDTALTVLIHVSNYNLPGGGILANIKVGSYDAVHNNYFAITIFNILLLGVSLLVFLNTVIMYLFHAKVSYIWFATAVLFAMISNILSTSLASFYFPELNYNWVFKIENFSAYMLVPTIGLFLFHFLEEKKHIELKILFALGLLFGLAMLILPLHVYRKYLTIVDVYVLLSGFYIVFFYLLPKTFREPRKTLLTLIAVAIMYLGGINDILNHFGIIHTGTLAYSGILAYMLVQSYHINKLFFDLFKKNITLNEELDYKNKNLEHLVAERTSELNDRNEELRQQSEELRANAEALQETNVQLEEKQQELWTQAEQLSSMNYRLEMEQKGRLDSIRYAKTIQEAILTPLERYREFFDSFVLYKPKDIVSGDFYWAGSSKLLPDTVFVAVIDCTGHGVPGGFMSMLSSRMLIDIVAKFPHYKTGEIVTALDRVIRESLNQKESANEDGLDLVLLKISRKDTDIYLVEFTGAKNNLYYSTGNGELQILKGDRKSVGGYRSQNIKKQFSTTEFVMQSGNLLYLLTDGFIDQNMKDRTRFGSQRLTALLSQIVHLPLSDQLIKLNRVCELLNANTNLQRDDITVVGLQLD